MGKYGTLITRTYGGKTYVPYSTYREDMKKIDILMQIARKAEQLEQNGVHVYKAEFTKRG